MWLKPSHQRALVTPHRRSFLRSPNLQHILIRACPGHFDEQRPRNVMILAKSLQVQMETKNFDPYNRISVICFLSTVNLAFDMNHIHEVAAMRLVPFITKKQAATVLKSRDFLRAMILCKCQRHGTLSTQSKAVRCLMESYTTDDAVFKTGAKCMRFSQPATKSSIKYGKSLLEKALCGLRVSDEEHVL